MNKLLMILCIGVMMPATGISQKDTTFRVVRTLKGDIVDFTVDNLDNVYILNSRNQVKKYSANGDSVAIYNDIRKYGRATLIDVSNPLKVLLYYRDFATVVMLDRFLNVVNIVDLRKQNIFQAKVIAQSYDNKIWVFDEMENKLKKIDEDGKLLQETPDFRLFMDKTIVPVEVADENKYVYLYDSTAGVYVFDYFGTLNNVIMIHHWQNLKITGNYIFGSRSDTLFRYDIKTFLYDEWKIPEQVKDAGTFNFTTSRLYALRKECEKEQNCISIYAIR